jgi:cell division protein FtsI/penicillin-binding protein 2
MPHILQGTVVRDALVASMKAEIAEYKAQPTLVIIQVGGRDDSNAYINQKKLFAERIGAKIEHTIYSESVTQEALLKTIEDITGIIVTSGPKFDAVVLSERKNKKIVLVPDIDFVLLSKLIEIFPNHENIVIDTHFKRFYPYKACGSHVVGYLGNIVTLANGQLGLEKLFNTDLCGKNGSKTFAKCSEEIPTPSSVISKQTIF